MIAGPDLLSASVMAGAGWARARSKASDLAEDPACPRHALSVLRLGVDRSTS
jgi:hypothetical protein